MVESYVSLILKGRRGFYEVPLMIREEVKKRIILLGRDDLLDSDTVGKAYLIIMRVSFSN